MKYICLLLLPFVFIVSCKKEQNTRPSKQDGLWPMNLQNEWKYKRTFYNNDGTVQSFSEEQTKITDTLTIKGHLFFKDSKTGLTLTNHGPDMVRGIMADTSLTDPFSVVFQRVYADDSVIWRIDDPGCNSNQSFRAYAGFTQVNGYECLRNERLSKKCDGTVMHRDVFYLKPGVGLVRQEEYVVYPGVSQPFLRVAVDLISYKLFD